MHWQFHIHCSTNTKMGTPEHNPLGCEAALGQDLVDLVGGEIRVGVVVHPLGQRLTLSGLANTHRDMGDRAKKYVNSHNVSSDATNKHHGLAQVSVYEYMDWVPVCIFVTNRNQVLKRLTVLSYYFVYQKCKKNHRLIVCSRLLSEFRLQH